MTAPTNPVCARCGEPIAPGARFCMKCGSDVSGEQGGVATAMMPAAKDENDEVLELLRQATIGDYEILRELGRGGMATVYLAHDIALDRKVALKVMSPALALMGEGMSERFKREARTAASLSHPNIIPIYTVKSHGKTLFFVMKFIAGRSLESLIKDMGPMPVEMVRDLMQQVGTALGYAHRHGIVHRDVKPANIMIDEEGWSVVTDFGIAKVAENRGLTMTGIAVGTPSYMSPEQCAAKDITGKSDQYSLGVVAYEMLTGKQPFEGDSAMAIMFAHFHEPPRPLKEHRPDIPDDVAAAVMRMLEKPTDKRWPSVEDALGAMGAEPLAHDDPVRVELVKAVRAKSNRSILNNLTPPPTSPVPPVKRPSPSDAATTPIPAARIVGVAITPATVQLHPGDTRQLAATPRVAGGTAATTGIDWHSADPAVATVSGSGLVTGVAPGKATITAKAEGVSGTALVEVTPVPVAAVAVEPAEPRLLPGASVDLHATLRDAKGTELSGRSIRWSVTPAGVAKVSESGSVTAVKVGKAEVAAECEGVKGVARLEVSPSPVAAVSITPAERSLVVGDTAALTARLTDAAGKPLSDRTLTWTSSAPAIVAVSPRGIVTGLAPGTAEVQVQCEGHEAKAQIRVTPVPVAALTIIQPDPLIAGAQTQLVVVLKDSRGNVLTGRDVKWSSSSPVVATVTPAGQLTAVAPGTARIAAESEGKSGTVAVTVIPIPVASVAIDGPPGSLKVGETATLRARALDTKGAAVTGRDVIWAATGDAVTVSPAGVVFAKAAGRASVTATIEGKHARIELTVVAPAVPEVTTEIIPPAAPKQAPPPPPPVRSRPTEPVSLPETAERAVPAQPSGGKGKLIGALVGVLVLAAVAFAVLRPKPGAEVPPAPPPPVNNLSSPVASLTIAGEAGPMSVGRTRQLAALLKDAAGLELSDRAVVWASSDPSVAEVSSVGAVTSHKAGTATITATSEGKRDEFGVVVEEAVADQPAAVATVALAGGSRTLDPGETLELAATVKDGKGNLLPDRTVVWSSADPKVATVSGTGVVTAVAPGQVVITASSEGKSGEARVSVNRPKEVVPPPATVASVSLTPANPTVTAGQALKLSADVLAPDGKPLTDRPVTWKSSDEDVARVAPDGTVTGLAKGSATITATAEGKSGTTRLTVNEATVPVSAVTLTPSARSIKVGETTTWTAVARDARGKELGDRSIGWSSSAPQVASVNGAGLITGVAPGTAEIRATVEGKTASVPVTVAAVQVTQLPPPVNPPAGPPAGGAGGTPATGGNAAILPRRAVEAGASFACGINPTGAVCWGGGFEGLSPIGGTAGLTGLVTGKGHACGLVSGGRAVCWGDNRAGQLGDGSGTTTVASAVNVAGDLSFSQLTAGSAHTCGLAGGKAYCWGKGKDGQLGDGSGSDRKKPTAVRGGKTFVALSAGGSHTCGITGSGRAYCWGDGFSGQLGYGALESQQEPIDVSGDLKFSRITAGGQHTCGVTGAGKAYCWGTNNAGQLGDGSNRDRASPQGVEGRVTFEEITAGDSHTCALTSGGDAYCWGENKTGQLGDGTKSNRDHPVAVGGGLSFTSISAGDGMTCGLSRSLGPVCWGRNEKGQLGDGGTTMQPTPTALKAGS